MNQDRIATIIYIVIGITLLVIFSIVLALIPRMASASIANLPKFCSDKVPVNHMIPPVPIQCVLSNDYHIKPEPTWCRSFRCVEGYYHAAIYPRKIPPQKKIKVVRSYTARVTVYFSNVGETDLSPDITANGEHVYWGGSAMNCVPFGTKFRIPKVFGTKVFRVNDRGSMQCGDPDIWLPKNDWHGWRGTTNTLIEIVKP